MVFYFVIFNLLVFALKYAIVSNVRSPLKVTSCFTVILGGVKCYYSPTLVAASCSSIFSEADGLSKIFNEQKTFVQSTKVQMFHKKWTGWPFSRTILNW